MYLLKRALPFIFLALSALTIHGCGGRMKPVEVKKEKIGDIELAYYIRGKGEPLVMIMGFRGTMSVWDPALLELLEKKHTLILFDNRGAGLSTDTENNILTINQMAQDTARLIKALGYEKAHVLGWSMGSRIAMELAIKNPEIVKTLILCSPNPGGKFQAKRKSNAYTTLTGKTLSEKEGLSLIFPKTPEGEKAANAFMARLTDAILYGTVPDDIKVSDQTISRQVQALKFWDENNNVYESLPNIKVPTLVAGGLDDVLDSPENVQKVACRIPYAWSAYYPDAGHDFHSQFYEDFAELVNVFIRTNANDR